MRALIIFFGMGLLASTAAFSAATPSYDGVWTVQGVTDVGPCEKSFGGEVRIQNNDIVSVGDGVAQAIGSIDNGGSLWARLTAASGVARGSGHVRGTSASGAWSSNTSYCGGRWTAKKTG